MDQEKLIITATTANSWIYPDVKNWAENSDQLIEDVIQCHEAGAAIAHVHLPRGKEVEFVKKIRERCDIIIQAGMSSDSIPARRGDFEARPDMMSIILNHHAEHFPEVNVDILHPVEELEEYCKKCKAYGIKPEWEVWNTGSYWNLQYLIDKKLIDGPHYLTLFFNWPGGTWSPPSFEEYMHRVKTMPKNCVYSVSTMGKENTQIAVLSLTRGSHIRVGTEDYPFIEEGVPAKSNAEIVKKFVSISNYVGRKVANPSEARKIIGI
ncbi:MAG: 3-keto-5-aminohexanoate cleavage protein [Promethearchaeota archaeon]|nr:MAG: 3-keto-5-aminohexanoate cleavage protein [Candidatus Lokiarchaeota archaeon]